MGSVKPAEFARAGERLAGTVEAAALGRLREQLANDDGAVRGARQVDRLHYEVVGTVTERGHDALVLQVKGELAMTCQRCLEPVRIAIDSSRRIIFAANAEALETQYEADDSDVVDLEDEVDVAVLIEDEVLLSLPLAPMHAPGACKPSEAPLPTQAQSPFAALAQLVRKSGET